MSLGWFHPAHPPGYDINRESGKLNREEHQGPHRSILTLLGPATFGSIDSVDWGV